MRVLVITNLFPSAREPRRGLFNLEQLRALSRLDDVRVVCPAPRTPGAGFLENRSAASPESHAGIRAEYPRYPYVPKAGQAVHDRLFEHGIRATVDQAVRSFEPHVLFATWAYPDVVAAGRLARAHQLPLLAKVHGTDVNDYFKSPRRRRLIARALHGASAVVAVSSALAQQIRAVGVEAGRVHVIPNGVDTQRFAPRDRRTARAAVAAPQDAPLVLFVGNLKPVKGIETLLGAFPSVVQSHPGASLAIIGAGPLSGRLRERASASGVGANVRFVGEQSPDEIARWMNAASVLCLPSFSEGMPNVVLEAGASGLPVVASRVGGIPEAVREGITGLLVPPGDVAALASALDQALLRAWHADRVRAAATPLSWHDNAARLHDLITDAVAKPVGP